MMTILARIAALGRRGLTAISGRTAGLAQRGMATAEYAVGILAAVALALVLLKVFNADGFLNTIGNLITFIFQKLFGWIP